LNGETIDEPFGKVEEEMLDTVECQNEVCKRHVLETATVDVVVGKITESRPDGKLVFGVKEEHQPEVENWCLNCASQEFDIDKPAGKRSIEESNDYLTPTNLAFFFAGVSITIIAASFMVV